MATTQIHFDISESILQSLNQNKEEFTQQTRLFTTLELFKIINLHLNRQQNWLEWTRKDSWSN